MKRLLIVDDHPEVRELVEITFAIGDYEIHKAINGGEALDFVRKQQTDVIILDIMMPGGIDGYDVCRRIKGDEATASCKVIILSARGQERDREMGIDAGADDYVVKPFSPAELFEKVEELLAG